MISYGIQMYSLRDLSDEDLEQALRAVSEMGYKYVEFAGYFGNSAEDVRSWLEKYGLGVCGAHICIDQLSSENIEATVKYHKALGCATLTVPCADWATEELLEKNLSMLNEAQMRLGKEGIRLAYHNHSNEFYPTSYGKIIEDEIIARTDIDIQTDVFWLYNAGIDPISYIEKYKSRIKCIHLKDGIKNKASEGSFENAENGAIGRSLGLGEVPIRDICDYTYKNGILCIVESEDLDPNGPEEVKRCINYLRSIEAQL